MITSKKNRWVHELKQLQKAKYRRQCHQFVLEGYHLVEEAVQAKASIQHVFYTQDAEAWVQQYIPNNIPCDAVVESVLKAMGTLPTPQGVIAVVDMLEYPDIHTIDGAIILLDEVQDPGNVGTIVRTADAMGCQAVVLNKGSVDIYNPKVLRAMQGSQYHIPIYMEDFATYIPALKEQHIPIYGTALDASAVTINEIQPPQHYALVMGNEGQGLSKQVLDNVDYTVYIPMKGQAESLNVGVATSIVLYQWQINNTRS